MVSRETVLTTASQIRAARALIGAKQSDLAKAAGISLATLNNIERGVGDPRTSTLDAIVGALDGAGIEFSADQLSESIRLRRLERPPAFDSLSGSQRVLELLSPRALIRVDRILFFARHSSAGGTMDEAGRGFPTICMLLEGPNRTVLLDQVPFTMANASRAAEVAGIMLGAFSFHRDSIFHHGSVLEDTTKGTLSEVVSRLRRMEWRPLTHPAEFFASFDDWEGRLMGFASREGHPLRDLLALFSPRLQ
jgi:transcriptional regulator with XRE-family HTH domain